MRFSLILPLDLHTQRAEAGIKAETEEKEFLKKIQPTTIIGYPASKENDNDKESENHSETRSVEPRITLKVKN